MIITFYLPFVMLVSAAPVTDFNIIAYFRIASRFVLTEKSNCHMFSSGYEFVQEFL